MFSAPWDITKVHVQSERNRQQRINDTLNLWPVGSVKWLEKQWFLCTTA